MQSKDSRFSLYIDEQLAPGGAINREAFILTKLSASSSLKVGKLMLPYGIRLEDDTAFIRQSTGFNWLGFTFLAEMDHIEDKSISHISGKYEEQRISFVEVNREITKGLNIKVTAEYLDPETNIDENERVRHSL